MGFRRVKIWRKYVRGVPTDEYKEEGYYDSTVYPDEDNCWGIEWRPVEGEYWCEMALDLGPADGGFTITQRVDNVHDRQIGWISKRKKLYCYVNNYGTYGFDEWNGNGWTEVSRFSRPSSGFAKQNTNIGYIDEDAGTATFLCQNNLVTIGISDGSVISTTAISQGYTLLTFVLPSGELVGFGPQSGSANNAPMYIQRWSNGYGNTPVQTLLTAPDGRTCIGQCPTFDIKNNKAYMGTVTQLGMVQEGRPSYAGFGDIWEYDLATLTFNSSKVNVGFTEISKGVSSDGTVVSLPCTMYVASGSCTGSNYPLMVFGGKFVWLNGYNANASSSSARNVTYYIIVHEDGKVTRQTAAQYWFQGAGPSQTQRIAVDASTAIANHEYTTLYRANT